MPGARGEVRRRRVPAPTRPGSHPWAGRWTRTPPSRSPRPSPGAPGSAFAARQELLRRRRAEQAAERAGQQQRPAAGVDALAGHVDERRPRELAVADGPATRKSPENDAPPAERSTTSADQPAGSTGSSPCARSRSRRSTSIDSPRVPCTPSRARDAREQQHDDRRHRGHEQVALPDLRTGRVADEPRQLAGHHEQQQHEAARGQDETADQDDHDDRRRRHPVREVRGAHRDEQGRHHEHEQREPVRAQEPAPQAYPGTRDGTDRSDR